MYLCRLLQIYSFVSVRSGLSHHGFSGGWMESLSSRNYSSKFKNLISKAFIKADSVFARIQLDTERLRIIKMDHIYNDCLACPKKGGTQFLCLDGCFTSSRLASKGKEQIPVFDSHYILHDLKHTQNYKTTKTDDNNCSTIFKATTETKSKYDKLEETGHFGIACARHEILLKMVDMKNGESFKYPDHLLKNHFISRELPDKLFLYYDVMCRYKPHIIKNNILPEKLVPNTHFLIGQFHVLPHGALCIDTMQPYTTPGNGFVDGEALERRWAFFRNHIHSIKQMTAQNRAIFLDRLVWWEYKTQTNQIVDRIIKKSRKCFKDLELYRLFNFKDFQISKEKPVDFININQSNLNETQILILSKIESISYDYETQKIFMSQKVRN
jgi:hypothetical protein